MYTIFRKERVETEKKPVQIDARTLKAYQEIIAPLDKDLSAKIMAQIGVEQQKIPRTMRSFWIQKAVATVATLMVLLIVLAPGRTGQFGKSNVPRDANTLLVPKTTINVGNASRKNQLEASRKEWTEIVRLAGEAKMSVTIDESSVTIMTSVSRKEELELLLKRAGLERTTTIKNGTEQTVSVRVVLAEN